MLTFGGTPKAAPETGALPRGEMESSGKPEVDWATDGFRDDLWIAEVMGGR